MWTGRVVRETSCINREKSRNMGPGKKKKRMKERGRAAEKQVVAGVWRRRYKFLILFQI